VGKPGHYTFEPLEDPDQYNVLIEIIKESHARSYWCYKGLIDTGIAKEISRIVIPVGIYSAQFASCNARSLMAFLSLRTKREDSKFPSYPQREIEMVAEQMEEHFARLMPLTYRAFNENGRVSP
jgi:thymidylate synthase (FAD)